ncbi:MAG: hypothetical protein Q9208_005558 [Pyrenodesmia sp. 3 TL-2023]
MTPTMTATSHQSSTNLPIPPTQNTAPVLSFSCLYTHDLRRKQKRWQDGVLKFHTFNKRIMVYDVPRNFIGDTHWSESQAIQDGDELELDRGVLIQVGEVVERTETDLTELLEKRTPKPAYGAVQDLQDGAAKHQTSTGSQVISTPRHRTDIQVSAPLSQLRPKSLNALLGKTRGPVGKAVVPTKSPAEVRREKEIALTEEGRSPKRRRVEYPNSVSPIRARGGRVDLPKPVERTTTPASAATGARTIDAESHDTSVSLLAKSRNHTLRRDQVDKQRKEPEKSHSGTSGVLLDDKQDTSRLASNHTSSISERARPQPQASAEVVLSEHRTTTLSSRSLEATSEPLPGNAPPVRSSAQDGESRSTAFDDEPRPENMLRIASKKPRKKLMYRDLLPQEAPPNHDVEPRRKYQRKESQSRRATCEKTVDTQLGDPLEDFHQRQRNRLQRRLSKRTASREETPEQHLPENEERNPQLLVSDRPHPLIEPDLDVSDSLFLTPPQPLKQPSPRPRTEAPSPSPPSLSSVSTSPKAERTLTETDAILVPHPPGPIEPILPYPQPRAEIHHHPAARIKAALPPPPYRSHRPLQRSTSDLTTRTSLPKAPPNPLPNNNLIKRSTSTLQKSLSDTLPARRPPLKPPSAAVPTRTTRTSTLYRSASTASDTPIGKEQVADPWSREAWDLFGYDGSTKRITSEKGNPACGGGLRNGNGGGGETEDLMMESQGYV